MECTEENLGENGCGVDSEPASVTENMPIPSMMDPPQCSRMACVDSRFENLVGLRSLSRLRRGGVFSWRRPVLAGRERCSFLAR